MKKGFTLIELLIVIGIIAILATTVVLILNPAELLAQSRDAQRLSDMDTLRGAINLYLSSVTSPDFNAARADTECAAGAGGRIYAYGTVNPGGNSFTNRTTYQLGATRVPDGTGWLPVNFNDPTLGGSPLSVLPVDPRSGDATPHNYYYRYACDQTNKTYELNACLESNKQKSAGTMDNDGGDKNIIPPDTTTACGAVRYYEVGNQQSLNL